MNIIRRKPAHRDARGVITDLHVGEPVNALTTVTCRKGSVRGNHFHKLTTQFTYVLSGRLRYFARNEGDAVKRRVVRSGDLVTSLPRECHAFEALEDSVLLAFCHGPRAGLNYESDTYRLAEPLTAPKPKRSRRP
ncbi:MAG: cupin 2 conserved barrel domain protein [Limisphaerales bacterium]|nr:MAG: cupin 2 conserved barrel domain protein [Limisphaerales bacterium]KAG0507127.1 MAG: cupin 2 conserved barrel domain protein [Limisphaerales bacterium]TXT49331.1 MAG: cupin 2 conserved barrel domain protein [Limisphaerales bacterium]